MVSACVASAFMTFMTSEGVVTASSLESTLADAEHQPARRQKPPCGRVVPLSWPRTSERRAASTEPQSPAGGGRRDGGGGGARGAAAAAFVTARAARWGRGLQRGARQGGPPYERELVADVVDQIPIKRAVDAAPREKAEALQCVLLRGRPVRT